MSELRKLRRSIAVAGRSPPKCLLLHEPRKFGRPRRRKQHEPWLKAREAKKR